MEHQQQNTLSRLSLLTPEEREVRADYARDHFFGSKAREQSASNSDIDIYINGTPKNVIPVKTGIYNHLKLLDSRFRGSDRLGIIRGSLMMRQHHLFV